MAGVTELIRTEADGRISFGNYELLEKTKRSAFEFEGDLYKVKTFREITRLERNERFVYESEPGTTVTHFSENASGMSFRVEGPEDAQITVQGDPETDYLVSVEGEIRGTLRSNLGGKLSFSVEMGEGAREVRIERR